MSEPVITCDKCGFQKTVTKLPEYTRNWFKKYHKNCGNPVYTCGIDPGLTKLVGMIKR